MTFKSFEASQETSQPIELYRFIIGPDTFEFTSSGDQQTHASLVYEPEPIERTRVGQSREERSNSIEITVPGNNEFAIRYISNVPGDRAQLTISRLQRLDTPTPEIITIFEGFVLSVNFTDNAKVAKIRAAPSAQAVSRPVPRFAYHNLCNHVLYDAGCKVSESDATFRFTGTVSAVSGNDITVPGVTAFDDGFMNAGLVEIVSINDNRLILNHVGDVLTLLLPFPIDAVGQSVIVLAGCDHSITICDTKFFTPEDPLSNVLNYGGFAFVPTKAIFESGLD